MKNPLPHPFILAMQNQRPADWQELASSLDTEAPVSVRLHPKKKHALALGAPVPWCSTGHYLAERPVFTLDPLFHAGGYYVQEASSMFIEKIFRHLNVAEGMVLDACASPGGKSTHLASLLDPRLLLVSNEAIRGRCAALTENITKWGTGNTVVTHSDPAAWRNLPGLFDVMLIDAPCSGEGLFRKDPAARTHWTAYQVAHCSLRQQRIVTDLWPALKTGGYLIYTTCTYNKNENEAILKSLVPFRAGSIQIPTDPSWGIEETCDTGIYGYRFFPHRVRGEGFFAAVIRKTESVVPFSLPAKKEKGVGVFESVRLAASDWLSLPAPLELVQFRDRLLAIPENFRSRIEAMAGRITVLQSGTTIGEIKNNKIVPAHDLAMSVYMAPQWPRLALNSAEALHYLRKETFFIEAPAKGFYLVTYGQQPLGWINHLGSRINNLYPPEWRIRMVG